MFCARVQWNSQFVLFKEFVYVYKKSKIFSIWAFRRALGILINHLVTYTVCPGSSDPQEKIFLYICIRKLGLHRFLTRLDKIVRFNILGWDTTFWTYSTCNCSRISLSLIEFQNAPHLVSICLKQNNRNVDIIGTN